MIWCGVYLIIALIGTTLIKRGGSEQAIISFSGLYISFKMIIGILFYGVSFLLYVFRISKMQISIVMPVLNALNSAAIVMIGVLLFKEKIVLGQAMGIVVVIFGVVLIGIYS